MKVTLISWTHYPEAIISMMMRNMMGEFYTNAIRYQLSYKEQIAKDVDNIFKTYLQMPLEFIHFTFQIEDIPRNYTHQLVRYRVGTTFAQESLRFVAKTGGNFKYHIPKEILKNERLLKEYKETMSKIKTTYKTLIQTKNFQIQNAKGILPINILTRIGVIFSYRALMHIAETRLCHQAEQFWQDIINQMKHEIANKVSRKLADHLQPICHRTKKCEFVASFDRPCSLQGKWKKNE